VVRWRRGGDEGKRVEPELVLREVGHGLGGSLAGFERWDGVGVADIPLRGGREGRLCWFSQMG
jgi:hypothetical protein